MKKKMWVTTLVQDIWGGKVSPTFGVFPVFQKKVMFFMALAVLKLIKIYDKIQE